MFRQKGKTQALQKYVEELDLAKTDALLARIKALKDRAGLPTNGTDIERLVKSHRVQ